jgi:diguanylate cyclase (GGDEF)-like protein/putative nucleotidyltransferase with HDIG domain
VRRANEETRLVVRAGAVALIALCLVSFSALAVFAARDSHRTSRDVRASTDLWNAYQQARSSLLRELLLTQEFRLAGSPDFEERFGDAAKQLSRALETVEQAGAPNDRAIAAEVLATNRKVRGDISRLVEAVNAGDAARAESVATKRLGPLVATAVAAVNRGAAAHQAESTIGLQAAERSESVTLLTSGAIFVLGMLLIGTAIVAVRFRRRLDAARRSELDRLASIALTDSLTGVLNHRAFHEALPAVVTASTQADGSTCLVMMDLDGLKEINDRYGHQLGDEQIRLLASTAAGVVSEPDRLYRLGGDEFALLLQECSPADALRTVGQIHGSFTEQASALSLGFSAGIAESEPGLGKEELVRRADLALIEAKRLQQKALLYSPLFEIAVAEEPAEPHHVRVLANALARAVDTKDAYTHSHCETVAELCALMALQLGFDEEHVLKVRLAGLLHDVGKIGVPDSILQKPGRLGEDEWEAMKAHPILGAHILAGAERHEEAAWVLSHHERPDGRGYPHRLGEDAIPLEARIISVADAFEAMVSERPYRRARSVEDALAELTRCVGTQFDARCVASLASVLGNRERGGRAAPPDLLPSRQLVPLGAQAA